MFRGNYMYTNKQHQVEQTQSKNVFNVIKTAHAYFERPYFFEVFWRENYIRSNRR